MKPKHWQALVMVALASMLWINVAHAAEVSEIRIVDYGIYTRELVKRVPTPGTASGRVGIIRNVIHKKTTNQIPAKRGISFGLTYQLIGGPKGAKVSLTNKTLTPGLKPPNRKLRYESVWRASKKIGGTHTRLFTLEHEYELVRGAWTM